MATNFSQRKVFRSSIHITLGGSRSRSIDEGSGSVDIDPNTRRLVSSALHKEKSPEFVIKPRRQFVNEGETAKFKATFDGSPSTELTWFINGKPVVSDGRYKIFTDENDVYMLEILKVKSEDQGTYVCKIENSVGAASADAELEVFVRPKPHSDKSSAFLPPTVDVPLEDTEFADKEKNATLVCKFHNGIDGNAKWYKDGKEVGTWQGKSTYDGRTARLVLREATKRICGVYECIVRNSGGEDKTRALVSLLDPSVKPTAPKFTLSLCDQDLEQGEKLVLEAEVEGKPRPNLKWYKDNEELGSSQDIRMEYKDGKGRLIVDNLDPAEGSKFTCVAQNVAGQDQTKADVNVKGSGDLREPPIFTKELQDMEVKDGDRVELSVEVKGTPPIDVVWVHNTREIPVTDPACRMVNEGDVRKLIVPEVFPEDAGSYVCEAYNDYGETDTFCILTVHEDPVEIQESTAKSPEFLIRPQKLHVTTGTRATLKCQVDGEPPPSVQWTKGGQKLKHGQKYKISSVGDEHFLEIVSASREDSGQYTCILCNPSGSTSATTVITVGEINHTPSSPFRPIARTRTRNSPLRKNYSTDSDSSDFSSLDNEQVKTVNLKSKETWSPTIEKKGGVSQVDFRGVLKTKIPPARNSGDLNLNSKTQSFKPVEKVESPSFLKSVNLKSANSGSLKNGSTVKNGNSLSQTRQKFELKSETVPNRVQNGKNNSTPTTSKLIGKAVGGGKVNQFLQKFENKETSPQKTDFRRVLKPSKEIGTSLVKNNPLKTTAETRSVPKPDNQNNTNGIEKFKTVKIERLKSVEEIISTSKTKDKVSQQKMDIKPEFKTELDNQFVPYGSQVVLKCEVAGTPNPDICWTANQKEIKQSKFFNMTYENNVAKLTIAEAYSEDEGEYTCKASNPAGAVAKSCNLMVQACSAMSETSDTPEEPFSPTATPPKIYDISPSEFCILRGGTIEFKASYTSVPAGSVRWYKNKTEIYSGPRLRIENSEHFSTLVISNIQPEDSGRYNITVENSLGLDTSSASLTVQDVPDQPVGQPWVSDVTLTSVTLSWYGPAFDGGCPVTNYRVEMCDAEDQEWNPVTSNCVNTTYKINKLTPHTPYFFRIFAENKHGISTPSQTTDVTVTSDRRPSALQRTLSVESDDVFTHEIVEPLTPLFQYSIVSPLSPEIKAETKDEIPFAHREVDTKPGRKFEDHYNCLQEVGKGKFGSVYRCEEKSTGKIWAAKIVKCRESEKKKIRIEVDIMNKLNHPKILMLWDVFDAPRQIILVMEYIGGGELFERVIDDDFELTERDCIQFMRQILDAIHYMHHQNILHLDLKPENILCLKNESNKIKIIDFGLARFYKPGESTRVLFGTPEFIAPEVVNYDEIGFTTDMWSVGVICYVLLSGISPFMGDSDAETLSNVTQGEFDFDDEGFDSVTDEGKTFIESLLIKDKMRRLSSQQALDHRWLAKDSTCLTKKLNTKNLKRFMARRKWQKTGNAIRALGRITSLTKLFKRDTPNDSARTGSYDSLSTLSVGSVEEDTDTDASFSPLKVGETPECDYEDKVKGHTNGCKTDHVISCDSVDKHTDINANNKQALDSAERQENRFQFSKNLISGANTTGQPSGGDNVTQHRINNNLSNQSHRKSERLKFTKEMVDSQAFPGDVVRFDVAFVKNDDTSVTWYFEEDEIEESDRHCIQQSDTSGSLIIKDVCEDDDGEYFCKIENNKNEEETCSAELIVYGAL